MVILIFKAYHMKRKCGQRERVSAIKSAPPDQSLHLPYKYNVKLFFLKKVNALIVPHRHAGHPQSSVIAHQLAVRKKFLLQVYAVKVGGTHRPVP